MVTQKEGERLAIVETKIDLLTTKVDKFIETADVKYASKHEVEELKQDVRENRSGLINLITKWGPFVGVVLLLGRDILL